MDKINNVNVITLPVGMLQTNCYIAFDENKIGFIVDPGENANEIIEIISKGEIEIKYIFLTHCHYDHIGALDKVNSFTGASVVVSQEDSPGIIDANVNLSTSMGQNSAFKPADHITFDDEKFICGSMEITAFATPGHTMGGVSYYVKGITFTGDTLFSGDIGRWDLPGGDYSQLKNSVLTKLYTLPEGTKVYPGHEESTTIGYEMKHNNYVRK